MNDNMLYFQLCSINSIHLIYIKIISQAKSHIIGTNSNICMQTGEQFCAIYLTSRKSDIAKGDF